MGESQKFIKNYRCNFCNLFVRDTKLERTNHESTDRHQENVKRYNRKIERRVQNDAREKERTQRELDRLNGVVSKPIDQQQKQQQHKGYYATQQEAPVSIEEERRKQLEQLVGLGVAIPSEYHGEMALPGEWVTVELSPAERSRQPHSEAAKDEKNTDARAVGVRQKRGPTEEEKEEEEVMRNLAKRKRPRWGRDTKTMPGGDDDDGDNDDLDALLSGVIPRHKKNDVPLAIKEDDGVKDGVKKTQDYGGPSRDEAPVKNEEEEDEQEGEEPNPVERQKSTGGIAEFVQIKTEQSVEDVRDLEVGKETANQAHAEESKTPGIVFRKRKSKSIRQK